MRCKVRRLLQRVAAFYRLEDQDVDDQAEIWAAGEVASEETTTGRCELTKELRMQCAPKKYKDFLQVRTALQTRSPTSHQVPPALQDGVRES
jgi:hypothetical protein